MSRFEGWLVGHVAGRVTRLVLGMAAGAAAGRVVGWPVVGTVVGGLLAGAWVTLRDARRAARLADWLHGPTDRPAPRERGFWGELAYRAERLLRRRERAIEAERERLRQFLSGIEASPNGVLLLDAEGHIEWCNGVAAQHFGLDPQRDLQQRATNLIRAPAFVSALQEGAFDEPVTLPGAADRGTLHVLIRSYGAGMKLVLSQDITERERAEAMRRDFVANVSHEIRTPLTVLAGFIETLAHLPLSETERHRVLALMQQQTTRMQALVADLLTLAQLEGSPRPAGDHWLAVRGLLDTVRADALALSGGRHRIEFTGGADAEVAGNEHELLSAFGNLLTNAIRYTPEGGRIIASWSWRDDGSACFEVEDTGIGIAREHIARITERFYRVDGSRSRETGGTGLGLAIVKHVLQRHGGEVLVESELGKGSTFRLVLPALRVRRRAASNEPLAA
ncbi:MAG: phosphate regulon sensor histidine kinase PhoR [Burkholderiales bacterium]|nr:phosphate regulon sensor histidine kinase PhoR [Burkholderiales bacterium]